jgi:hypothetical protein
MQQSGLRDSGSCNNRVAVRTYRLSLERFGRQRRHEQSGESVECDFYITLSTAGHRGLFITAPKNLGLQPLSAADGGTGDQALNAGLCSTGAHSRSGKWPMMAHLAHLLE